MGQLADRTGPQLARRASRPGRLLVVGQFRLLRREGRNTHRLISLYLACFTILFRCANPGFAFHGGPVRRDEGPLDLRLIPAYPCYTRRLRRAGLFLPFLQYLGADYKL